MGAIQILLAEQQPLIAAGLKYFIAEQETFTICGEAGNRDDLFTLLKNLQPRLLIIAHDTLPGFRVSDFAEIQQIAPDTNILAISSKVEKNEILQVAGSGVIGFLTRECSYNEIINAIRATAGGEKFYCGKILDILTEKQSPAMALPGPDQLTSREIQIIRCITEGQSTKEIADNLNLSMHTINAYRKSILQKMEVRSPAELAVRAIKMGIINI